MDGSAGSVEGAFQARAAELSARLDRIPMWGISYLFLAVLGLGSLFIFYDIFNVNVSIVQAAAQIFHVGSPALLPLLVGTVIFWNLLGYIMGALALGPLSDQLGRKRVLLITMLVTGIGALFNTLATGYYTYLLARFITGFGIGAYLSVVNTYVAEVAPVRYRAKYTSWIFLFSAVGAFLGIWIGLFLTTPAAPFPEGLPFALGAVGWFSVNGWRVVFAISAILALMSVLLTLRLPESPRWLLSVKRVDEAEAIISSMEDAAMRKAGALPPIPDVLMSDIPDRPSYRESLGSIFGNRTYAMRWIMIALMWMFGYTTVYTIAGELTSILTALGYQPSTAGMIPAIGMIGFMLVPMLTIFTGEDLDRHYWIPIAASLTVAGALLIGIAGADLAAAFAGSILLLFGENLWIPIGYAWTAESFPTKSRVTGFALADGVGHLGGIGPMVIGGFIGAIVASQMPAEFKAVEALLLVAAGLVVATLIALINGTRTRGKRFEEISP